jgi:hypothetical protein
MQRIKSPLTAGTDPVNYHHYKLTTACGIVTVAVAVSPYLLLLATIPSGRLTRCRIRYALFTGLQQLPQKPLDTPPTFIVPSPLIWLRCSMVKTYPVVCRPPYASSPIAKSSMDGMASTQSLSKKADSCSLCTAFQHWVRAVVQTGKCKCPSSTFS